MNQGFESGSASFDEMSVDWGRVSELLILSGLISQDNLNGAANLAMKMLMPLGRVLSMHGYLNENIIANAIELERLVSRNELTLDAAIRALQAIERDGENLQKVLTKGQEHLSVNQLLGDSLRKIGAVSVKQLRKGLSSSLETGLPIGWVLAWQGIITESLLSSAISAQRMILQNLLSEDAALNYLRIARLQQKDFRKVLSEQKIDTKPIDPELLWSYLLIKSGAALRTEVLACREFAIIHNATLEQYLFGFGLLGEQGFAAVQAIVSKVTTASLSVEQGVEILAKLKRVDWNMARLDATPSSGLRVELPELLGLTALLSKEQLQALIERSSKEGAPLPKLLVDGGYMEQVVLDALEKSKKFINQNSLHLHKALALIPYCADNSCTLEEAIARFGWAPIKVLG